MRTCLHIESLADSGFIVIDTTEFVGNEPRTRTTAFGYYSRTLDV